MRMKKKNTNTRDNLSVNVFQYNQNITHLLESRRKDLFVGTFTRSAQDSAIFVPLKFSNFKRKFRGKVSTWNRNLHELSTLIVSKLDFPLL